ncbi:bifunctional homocysteine S-methyltransferase/methylenetetrahydrofolate reductase [Paenibacillus phoenicis]|uniref:Bifunctional homocysteine S-methyltransferase/methylenetetrahydrofolate reductase n=1 Tax=Paenibacillus phoenicis TaxID=554117 RepID=A0ABU5PJI3_9BACL|nr:MULTISPECIES: bifunctional homocysteine S-methyltransferase/methylenetetrahydrofolate reductase [Paenibacillus]EES72825.1 putative bifunctional homocysteine S-methyltransferase/5,10-methylenetetrahydrofolate reductase protein [Paenibacillus sp. oral taxon 786 str. D14]MEA3570108.1 bifunctional homocysteine S-methyltransferase/methylenetetrahydrofolate reductase [Paenibacillus phoenicis]
MKPDLRTTLEREIIVGDGAMGTYLYQLGFPVGISYEEFNLLRPDVIGDIHRRYLDAGARLLETNTFSANYYKLSKFGLEAKVEDINRAAVRIAKQAAGERAYVAGAVGSIRGGKRANVTVQELGKYFEQQIAALLSEGVDALLFETFYDLGEMRIALGQARKLTDVPVICQFAVDQIGRTLDGFTIPQAFGALVEEGADVVGFNCHSGPKGIMGVMDDVEGPLNVPMSVFPNAGLADYIDGEYVYGATPDYFGECARAFADLGARLIGGCCGTTPEHIAAMAKALEGYAAQPLAKERKLPEPHLSASVSLNEQPNAVPAGSSETGAVSGGGENRKLPSLTELVKERHTVIVELDPPRDLDIGKFMEGAAALKEAGIDALTLADNSLAVTRMSNMALGHLVQSQLGLRPLVHIACRDRNLIGTQSHMMGFDALGIDHVLAVTGDPARFGDLPGASSVYDLTSFEIIRMIKQLNEGISFSGKPLKQKAKFVVGAAFNPNVKHLHKAVERLEKKIASGADYIMTQPVYDPELIVAIKQATAHLDVPIFIGIMPLASGKNAEYLHNEVPGIQLSDEVRKRMEGLQGEEGRAMGVEIAKELLDTAMEHFNGIYLMTPFMFYEMNVALTNYIREKSKRDSAHLSRLS